MGTPAEQRLFFFVVVIQKGSTALQLSFIDKHQGNCQELSQIGQTFKKLEKRAS